MILWLNHGCCRYFSGSRIWVYFILLTLECFYQVKGKVINCLAAFPCSINDDVIANIFCLLSCKLNLLSWTFILFKEIKIRTTQKFLPSALKLSLILIWHTDEELYCVYIFSAVITWLPCPRPSLYSCIPSNRLQSCFQSACLFP